jgi:hypothetical protein
MRQEPTYWIPCSLVLLKFSKKKAYLLKKNGKLTGESFKRELFDTDKMVTINLKREESIVLMDRDDNLWELFKNKKGRYNLKKLKGKQHGT